MMAEPRPTPMAIGTNPYLQITPAELAIVAISQFVTLAVNLKYLCGLIVVQLVLGIALLGSAYFAKRDWSKIIAVLTGVGCGFIYAMIFCALLNATPTTTTSPVPAPTATFSPTTTAPTTNSTTM